MRNCSPSHRKIEKQRLNGKSLPGPHMGGAARRQRVFLEASGYLGAAPLKKRRKMEDLERASSMLPFELWRVLHLQAALRRCYVLRFLVGLPREACGRLLRLEIRQIDEWARTAMLELPAIQRNGTC
jgi:hypothetical protein